MVDFRTSYCKSSLCMHGEKIHAYGMHKLEQFCAQCGLAVYIKLCKSAGTLTKSPPSSSHMHNLSHLVWTISTHYLVTFPKRIHPGFREFRTSQHASLHAPVAQHPHHLYCKVYTGSRLTSESSLKYFSSHTRLCTDLHPCIFLNFSKGINNVAPFVRKVTFFFKFLLLAHSTMAPGFVSLSVTIYDNLF